MVYTDEENIEKVIQRELTTEEKTALDLAIDNASQIVSTYLNRNYIDIDDTTELADSVRYYDGNGQRELFIDDFQSLTSVELLDSEGDLIEELNTASEWILYPLNSATKNSIVMRDYRFPLGNSRVKITAKFSSGNLPNAVIMATSLLVADMLSLSSTPGALNKESIEGYSYEYKSGSQLTEKQLSILKMVDSYRKIEI
jgi:hypothetical protein